MDNKETKRKAVFETGQLWKYKTKPGEEDSRLLILKVEELEPETAVHISILGDSDFPAHMPFSANAINKSVVMLVSEDVELPDFQEGYEYWRKYYDLGEAGLYKISVAEALEL